MGIRGTLTTNLIQQAVEAAGKNNYALANTSLVSVGMLVGYKLPALPKKETFISYRTWFYRNFPKLLQHIDAVINDNMRLRDR